MRARCRNAVLPRLDARRGRRPTPRAPTPAAPGRTRTRAATGRRRRLIAFRFSVASTSDWPPERNTIPGTIAGTCRRKQSTVSSATCDDGRLRRALLPGDHHVRLEQHPLERDALPVELLEHERAACATVTSWQRSIVLSASISTSGSTIGTMPGLLRERRVAGERVRVDVDAGIRRDAVADRDHRAPLAEARAELVVLREARAQAVEALGDLLLRVPGEVLRARVDLDPGDDALRTRAARRTACRRRPPGGSSRRRGSRRRCSSSKPGRREEQVPVRAAVLLGRLDADRVEPLLDRARRLVRGEDALVVGDDRAARSSSSSCAGHQRVSFRSQSPQLAVTDGAPRSAAPCPSASASRSTPSRSRPRRRARRAAARPPVTPVAATKTSSPRTRSSCVSTCVDVEPGLDERRALVVVARPEPPLERAADGT